MKGKGLGILFFLMVQTGFSAVYLYNDTPFPLKARVVAANGVEMGIKMLQPQELSYLEDQIGTSNPVGKSSKQKFQNYKNSLTPYQVFWYCAKEEGALYATCTNVSAGATVMATTCSGPCYCKPPKEKKGESEDVYAQE